MSSVRPTLAALPTFARALRVSVTARQTATPCAFACKPAQDSFHEVVLLGRPSQVAVRSAEVLHQTSRAAERMGRGSGYLTGALAGTVAGASLLACRLQGGHNTPLQGRSLRTAVQQGFRFGYALGKAPTLLVTAPLDALAWGLHRAQGA